MFKDSGTPVMRREPALKADLESIEGAMVVTPRERIDSAVAPAFEHVVMEAVDRARKRVVVDLATIDYISSAGLRVMLVVAKKSRALGLVFVICGMRPEVLKVFETTGLVSILRIVPDRSTALQSA